MSKINVTLPGYNEEVVLEKNFLQVYEFLKMNYRDNWEIVIAENGSEDSTLKIAKKLAIKFPNTRVISTEKGRGRAIKKSWESSDADLLTYMDLDLSTQPKEILKLIKALQKSNFAFGSRLIKGSVCQRSFARTFVSKIYNKIIRTTFKINVQDTQCGFKGIRREVKYILKDIDNNRWFFDTELVIRAARKGISTKEVPVAWIEKPSKERKSKIKIISDSLVFILDIVKLKRCLK